VARHFHWLAVLLCLAYTDDAHACACCADPGDREQLHWTLSTNEKIAMDGAKYSGTFRIDMMDVPNSELEKVAITGQMHDGAFSLWANHQELLRLALPDTCEELQTDTGADTTEVILYKERTFDCAVQNVDPRLTRYLGERATLVLQGHGNHCFALCDLEHWIVQFQDKSRSQASPRAYGRIDTSTVPEDWYKIRR
jgi:hypothetical protein